MSFRPRLSAVLTAALVAAASFAGPFAGARPAAAAELPAPEPGAEVIHRPDSGVFTVEGGGFGHGIGMSQYGARGAAAQGLTHEQILDFYYPGTELVTEAASSIRVGLTIDHDGVLVVARSQGLTARAGGVSQLLPTGPTRWRVRASGAGCTVESQTGGTWSPYPIKAGNPCPVSFSSEGTVRVVLPTGEVRAYRGSVAAVHTGSGALTTVNTVSLQHYLRSVVPAEMPTYFGAEALKSQSVAARTYARQGIRPEAIYDVCDTTACQVYAGAGTYLSDGSYLSREFAQTNQAVAATSGQVLMYTFAGGSTRLATTMFSSSNGGQTAAGGAGHGYLTARPDPYDGAPGAGNGRHAWAGSLPAATLQSRFGFDRVERIQILSRDGHGQWGGRVDEVAIEGTAPGGAYKRVDTTGAGLRNTYSWPTHSDGISSTYFRLSGAGAPPGVSRIEGENRYDTAAEVSATFEPGVPVAYVATGADYPDALAGAARAGHTGGPVLLTKPGELPSATGTELARLQPERIIVLGGSTAVSDTVLQALKDHATADTPDEVTRIDGQDRYETAANIAATYGTGVDVAYVATGLNYPDALAGAALAGHTDGPVLLTKPGGLPSDTATALQALRPERIIVLGGSTAVSDTVLQALKDHATADTPDEVTRIDGQDRYDTAAEIAGMYGTGVDVAYVATGLDYPDALAGAALAGHTDGPVLLTKHATLPGDTAAALEALQPDTIVVLGGTTAVSTEVETALGEYVH